jgi:hypothetical protein
VKFTFSTGKHLFHAEKETYSVTLNKKMAVCFHDNCKLIFGNQQTLQWRTIGVG